MIIFMEFHFYGSRMIHHSCNTPYGWNVETAQTQNSVCTQHRHLSLSFLEDFSDRIACTETRKIGLPQLK